MVESDYNEQEIIVSDNQREIRSRDSIGGGAHKEIQ